MEQNWISKQSQQVIIFAVLAMLLGGVAGIFIIQLNKPLYILFGILGLVAFVVSVFSVEWGIVMLTFITYTRLSDIMVHYHGAPSVAKYFVVLLAVVILIRWALFHDRPDGWQLAGLLIGIYGVVEFASLFYAPNTERVMYYLSNFAKDAIVTLVIVILLKNGDKFRYAIWTLIATGIFLGTLSVYQYLTDTFVNDYGGFAQAGIMQITGDEGGYRISGPIGDPNFFAQAMLVLVPISLERMLHERNRSLRLLAGFAMAVSTMTVVLTYSRGGFLALMVTFIAMFIVYPPRIQVMPYFLIFATVALLLVPKNYYERILSLQEVFQAPTLGFRTTDFAIRGRASENAAAFAMFRDHPLIGVGLGNYVDLYQEYSRDLGFTPTATERSAHNLYLEVLAETGTIGLAAFLVIVWFAVKTVAQARDKFLQAKMSDYVGLVTAFGIGFLGYLVAAVFIHSSYPRYFYLLIGIAFSLSQVSRNTIIQASES